ncbi:hypothetical protein HD806DRAFT_549798 [Xylariaceae sp. AK1471]|nr:hypothetical protein HD806DRAFT_549798 [Xylariaceae sp. AK1471]
MSLRRNHPDRRVAADTLVRRELQDIDKDEKAELLVDCGLRDSATGGDICQTSIPYRGGNAGPRFDGTWGNERKKAVLREALSHMSHNELTLDGLLESAAARLDANGGAIIQKAIDCRIARNRAREQAGDQVKHEVKDEVKDEKKVKKEEKVKEEENDQ